MRKTGISKMHEIHGRSDSRCGDCCNLETYRYRGRTYRKCIAYGVSHSDATDWRLKYMACGLFGKPFEGTEFRAVKEVADNRTNKIIDGQICLGD